MPKIIQDQNIPRYFKKKTKILARFLQERSTCIILKDLAQDFGLGTYNQSGQLPLLEIDYGGDKFYLSALNFNFLQNL